MDIPTLLLLLLVSVTLDFHLPLEWRPAMGQLRCEERESSHRLGSLEGVHGSGVRNAGRARVEDGRRYVYLYMLLHA
jgi:hypothetical protein